MKKMRDVSPEGMVIIDQFSLYLSGRSLHPRTVQEYMADLKHFIGWHEYQGMDSCQNLQVFSFDQISDAELATYLQAMKDVDLKASTINRRLSTIKLFFDWAEQQQMSQGNPARTVKLMPLIKNPPQNISESGKKILLDAVKAHGSLRDQAILKLMIHTSLRAEEICDLQRSNLQLQGKTGRLMLGDSVPSQGILLNAACTSVLERYLRSAKEEGQYLFSSEKTGGRLSERALRHLIKKYMDIAGFKGLSTYSLRRHIGSKNPPARKSIPPSS